MEKGDGMSFAEFSYPLLQAWDWWHMYATQDITVQVGGSDQYGNIVAGMDAIKHISQQRAVDSSAAEVANDRAPMGITVPLLTTSSGEKFGKSAGNAIWLDTSLTSPFDLYGFLLRSSDEDVARYLKLFTFVPLPAIDEVMAKHAADPGKRVAQHLLACEVLELVHGPEVAARTKGEHLAMRNPNLSSLLQKSAGSSTEAAENQAGGDTAKRTLLPRSLVSGAPLTRVLWHAGLAGTKSEAARLVKSGGVYVASLSSTSDPEQDPSADAALAFTPVDAKRGAADVATFIRDGLLVLRLGKWKVRVVEIVDDDLFEGEGGVVPGWEEWRERQAGPS